MARSGIAVRRASHGRSKAQAVVRVPGGEQGLGGSAEAWAAQCPVLARGGGASGFYDFVAVTHEAGRRCRW